MKELKQLAGQTMIYGLGTMVPRLLNYIILTPYYLYNLFENTPAEYGKVTELYAYMAFLMILLTYGMETAFFRFSNTEKNKQKVFNTIFTAILTTSIIFLTAVYFFSNNIAEGLKYEGEIVFVKLLAAILAVEAITAIPFARLRIENKATRFAVLKFVNIALNILLMIGIYNIIPKITGDGNYLLNNEGIVSAKFIFIVNLFASSTILILLLPELKGYRLSSFEFAYFKPILIYGLPLMISGLAGTMNETLDRAVYKHIIIDENEALTELGIYGANYKIGGFLLIFIQMFRYAAEPYFFNKAKDRDAKTQYAQLMNIFVGVIVAMGLMVLIFLDYFKFFISPPYRVGLYVVPFIVVGYIFYGILFNLSVWYKLSNKTQYALIIMLIGSAITVCINILFVPKFKYGASAVAHVISYSCMVVLSYILSRKYYKIEYNIGRVFMYLLIGVAFYFATQKLKIDNIVLDIIVRGLILSLFVIFVAWKEKILTELLHKKNAN